MATTTKDRPDELRISTPYPTSDELDTAETALAVAGEFAERLAMNFSRLQGDEKLVLDPTTAWNLHVYADGLLMEAENLVKFAKEIDDGIMSVFVDQVGRGVLYR